SLFNTALAFDSIGAINTSRVMKANTSQLALSFPEPKRRGGARRGAGRKPQAVHLRQTPHRARPVHRKAHPVHVTLRAGLRVLRTQRVARALLGGLRDSNRDSFRIVHYSVQENHVHLEPILEPLPSPACGYTSQSCVAPPHRTFQVRLVAAPWLARVSLAGSVRGSRIGS